MASEADAVLLGAVGGPKWEPLDIAVRPEKGLLGPALRPWVCSPTCARRSCIRNWPMPRP